MSVLAGTCLIYADDYICIIHYGTDMSGRRYGINI